MGKLLNRQNARALLALAFNPTTAFSFPKPEGVNLVASFPHTLVTQCPHGRRVGPYLRCPPRRRPRIEKLRSYIWRSIASWDRERSSKVLQLKSQLFKDMPAEDLEFTDEMLLNQWVQSNKTLGPLHPATVRTMINFVYNSRRQANPEGVAAALKEVCGDSFAQDPQAYEKILLHLKNMLGLISNSFGPEDPYTLDFKRVYLQSCLEYKSQPADLENFCIHDTSLLETKEQLAITLFQLGALEEAEKLRQEVQQARHTTWGAQHPDTLASKELFVRYFHNLSEIRSRKIGPEHRETLKSQNDLARAFYQLRNLEKAEKIQRVVLQARNCSLGLHPDTLLTMSDLARTLRDRRKYGEAKILQSQVVEGWKSICGTHHPKTIEGLRELGTTVTTQQASGDLKNALIAQRDFFFWTVTTFGSQHPETLTAADDLAIVYQDLEKYERAEELQRQVLKVRTALFGPEYPSTLTIKERLANTLASRGDLDGPKSLLQEVVEVREKRDGPEHPDTLMSKQFLAKVLQDRRELWSAETLQQEVLDIRYRTLGPDHEDTLSIKSNLATTFFLMQRLVEAKKLQQEVYQVRNHTLGPDHPDTLDSMKVLACILDDYGDPHGAEDLKWKISEAMKRHYEQINVPSRVPGSREVTNSEVTVGEPVAMPEEPSNIKGVETNQRDDMKMGVSKYTAKLRKWYGDSWCQILRKMFTDEVTRKSRKYVLANMCWAFAVWIAHKRFDLQQSECLAGPLRLFSPVVFFLLFLRIQEAYRRYEHGKKIWENLKCCCFELARRTAYSWICADKKERIWKLVRRFPFVLAEHLGSPSDQGQQSTQDDNPNTVINKLYREIQYPRSNLSSTEFKLMSVMLDKVDKLAEPIQQSESLERQPMPFKVLCLTSFLLICYMRTAAVAFVATLGILIVPIMSFVCWAVFSILEIALMIEQPFRRELKLSEMNRQIADTVDQIFSSANGEDDMDEKVTAQGWLSSSVGNAGSAQH